MTSALSDYNKKRDFKKTQEPKPVAGGKSKFRFVVQKHAATRLHYDLRLELEGVLKSWAVPKGVSDTAGEKRLAVQTEDHPVKYIDFAGIIPKGNYGAGKMEIFDAGTFTPINENGETISEKTAVANLKKGELKFLLQGKKIKGSYVLVHMKGQEKNWLLIKHIDALSKASTQNTSFRFSKKEKLENYIKPMLAHSAAVLPKDEGDFFYEIKWDGYRAIAECGSTIQLYSRNGISFADRFAYLLPYLKKLKHNCILDGEIVWLEENGHANFQQLQNLQTHAAGRLAFMVFDILMLDGQNTRALPLIDRKLLLKKLLSKNKTIMYSEHVLNDGAAFFSKAKELGLEGVMAKQQDSVYSENTRSKNWLKIKANLTEDVYVIGFTKPKGSRKGFGSLILGTRQKAVWKFSGHVGTGFSTASLTAIYNLLLPLQTEHPVVKEKIPVNDTPVWVNPSIMVEIKYTEKTKDGVYRHPSFIKLRDDKIPVENKTKSTQKKETLVEGGYTIQSGSKKLLISNPQKIFWPKEKITKAELAEYYKSVSAYILPHLKNRPLSLKRNPNGIADAGFYHKDAGEHAPDFVKVFKHTNQAKTIDYIVCNNEPTLLYLANLGCIEMNPWNNRYNKPGKPDWLALDIDPGPHNNFKQVVSVANAIKILLDEIDAEGFCKTSGASGLHIYLPLFAKYDYDIVRQFAQLLMSKVQERLPKITTTERSLAKRGKKIYLDFLQNRPGQTLASVYSVRPVPGATVSTPIHWDEVNENLHPSQFTLRNVLERINKKGDLFAPVIIAKTNIKEILKRLEMLEN